MLEELRIRGLGVIADAALPLSPGLTAVTGETGAGKTMVVSGLRLLFGGRADADRVRNGEAQAVVDGRLLLAPGSAAAVRVLDAGGEIDADQSLVIRRTVSAAGRSRAYVGGAPAPVALLTELADQLLTLHGQSDQIRLVRPGRQRELLDRYAGLDLDSYRRAYERWRAADRRLADRLGHTAQLRREADLLQHGLAEVDAAAPEAGEDVELTALSSRLAYADALRVAAKTAHDTLVGDVDADGTDVAALLGAARKSLAQEGGQDPQLDAIARQLDDVAALVSEAGHDLASYGDRLESDPQRLAQVQSRRSVLASLVRKYADQPDDGVDGVLGWAERARARLSELDVSDSAIASLTAERDAAGQDAAQRAARLRASREKAARRLQKAVDRELAGLAMRSAAVVVQVRPRTPGSELPALEVGGTRSGVGPDGADDVEFAFRAHPDAPLLPLGRGISGGELSRLMLAVEVCLAGAEPVPIMVFDEVDAGVGGRAGLEVGKRLARLARDRQVIVVTHLPQVAAYADQHIVVGRDAEHGVSSSDVQAVTGEDRIAELARMLGGTDTGAARAHATELLADAAGPES